MPKRVRGRTVYTTKEVAETLGVSKQTLLRWFREDRVSDPSERDYRGWRIFSKRAIERLRREVEALGTRGRSDEAG